jgi:hypothetical protein
MEERRTGHVDESTFSKHVSGLQLAWDSVSSGEFKRCARAYQLGIFQGWQSRERSVDLDFGIFLHSAREHYYRLRSTDMEHEEALVCTLAQLMEDTWDARTQRPWEGNETKNRFTLARALVDMLDHWRDDPCTTLLREDGKPMVEFSFRFGLRFLAQTGEEFMLAGRLDRVVDYNGQIWGDDLKTTKSSLDEGSAAYFFAGFSPDNQISLYTYALQVILPRAAQGMLVSAVQIAQSFTRCARAPCSRTRSQLAEWLQGFKMMLVQAEAYARAQFWPMNERACFRCQFRPVCALPSAERQGALERDYVKREWDPLRARGEA